MLGELAYTYRHLERLLSPVLRGHRARAGAGQDGAARGQRDGRDAVRALDGAQWEEGKSKRRMSPTKASLLGTFRSPLSARTTPASISAPRTCFNCTMFLINTSFTLSHRHSGSSGARFGQNNVSKKHTVDKPEQTRHPLTARIHLVALVSIRAEVPHLDDRVSAGPP